MKDRAFEEQRERTMDTMYKPLTPKSERVVAGSIRPVGIPDKGCPHPRCVLSPGHEAPHWPGD